MIMGIKKAYLLAILKFLDKFVSTINFWYISVKDITLILVFPTILIFFGDFYTYIQLHNLPNCYDYKWLMFTNLPNCYDYEWLIFTK